MSVINKTREVRLAEWLQSVFGCPITLTVVSGDASFRRYYRFFVQERSYIAVDAPPETEKNTEFVELAEQFKQRGLLVPNILHYHANEGFICVTDLGNTLLFDVLKSSNVKKWYRLALEDLFAVQAVTRTESAVLPPYDEALLRRELTIFSEWLLDKMLAITLSPEQQQDFQQAAEKLIQAALAQPVVGVHRDYHCRNLMVVNQQYLATLDFQDAVRGPITYDAVSLLRDCYIEWPDEIVYDLAEYFRQRLEDEEVAIIPRKQFRQWFDWMGVQRHIKASGIFARLALRDGKTGYLKDIPRTLNYVLRVSERYPELQGLTSVVKMVSAEFSKRAPE